MITKPSFLRSRSLKILLGVTLGVAVALTLLLLFVPEKEGFSHEAPGVLLCADGTVTPCVVGLHGTMSTYAFDADRPICNATLLLDGQEVGEVRLTFDGSYAAAGEDGIPAVLSKEREFAALIHRDGTDCLLLSPAPEGKAAQELLARFLADVPYARRQGWEAFQTE
ncbi:MAG: hypothetical protein IJJ99_04790 [Oscillospiraceae bacterium]|nr:hypothetical protein [Oscillospiraceae bacterium]